MLPRQIDPEKHDRGDLSQTILGIFDAEYVFTIENARGIRFPIGHSEEMSRYPFVRNRKGVFMLTCARGLFISAVAFSLAAQQNDPLGAAKQPIKSNATVAPKNNSLTVDEIISLAQAGLAEDLIIARLRKENRSFDLSSADMIRLKNAKVSDNVMRVMLDPKVDVTAPPPPPTATQSPVVITSGLTTIANTARASSSGATPAPGAEAKGDPNDPLTPHDSGIYLVTTDRDGQARMVVLERASYQGSKSGGLFTSAMTYGIIKAKTKAIIPGPHAGIRVAQSPAVFYFYFDDKQAGLGKSYFGVQNLSNPNQFALLRLEVNKGNRESTVGSFSALGSSSGADIKAITPFKSERIQPGLYKVTVDGLKSGEFCFVATSNLGAQMPIPVAASASATTDIFDFGADIE
jgi:hypothetical protein